jgi:hypothetical protein
MRDAERYAEGRRVESECRCCGSPIWIVYHGPQANHTKEPRVVESGHNEQTDDEDREPTSNVALRAAYEAYERAMVEAPAEEHGRQSFLEYLIDQAVDAAVVIERERTVAAVVEALRERRNELEDSGRASGAVLGTARGLIDFIEERFKSAGAAGFTEEEPGGT